VALAGVIAGAGASSALVLGAGVAAREMVPNHRPTGCAQPPRAIARFTSGCIVAAARFLAPVARDNTEIHGASVESGKMPTMKAAERERRDAQVPEDGAQDWERSGYVERVSKSTNGISVPWRQTLRHPCF
jgi:hypothetical protein